MTDDDGVRVTNRDVYDTLIQFKKEFGDYVKDQGPKMALLEYKVTELEGKQKRSEEDKIRSDAVEEERKFAEKQTRRLYLWGFAGSSVILEVANWVVFHK
jgi:hypothetical protein